MIKKSKVRAFVRERGFRLSADALPALEDAVQTILARGDRLHPSAQDPPRKRNLHGPQPGITHPKEK